MVFDGAVFLAIRTYRAVADAMNMPSILNSEMLIAAINKIFAIISHPYITFDKWRLLPLVNDQYDVIDYMQTFFKFNHRGKP